MMRVSLTIRGVAEEADPAATQDDNNGQRRFPDMTIDDAKKGADYYFCKQNYHVYKKIITRIALGYYKAPELKCEDKP
jgi:hypothetical protein